MSFTEICRRVGINARQRIIMKRYLIERLEEVKKQD
jgi:hypothetical protein